MKKVLSVIIIIFLVTNLTACKNESTISSDTNNEKDMEEEVGDNDREEDEKVDNNKEIQQEQVYPNTKLDKEDLKITYKDKTISYSMAKDDIIKLLGEPIKKKSYEEESIITYIYNGLEVTFVQDYLDVLQVKGNEYKTIRKIQVGDSLNKVFEKYGQENPIDIQENKSYYMYLIPMDMVDAQLFFVVVDNKVEEFYICNSL